MVYNKFWKTPAVDNLRRYLSRFIPLAYTNRVKLRLGHQYCLPPFRLSSINKRVFYAR